MEETTTSTEAPKKSKGMGPVVIAIIIVLVVIALFVGYKAMKSKKAAAPVMATPTPTTAAMKVEPTAVATGAAATPSVSGQIVVTGANYSFTPNTITVKKGQKVTIDFKNSGGFHNFMIKEFNVTTPTIGSGKEEMVSFTPDKVGTFEFYCSVANHRSMGMVGKLIVTP